jgi:uncharacterized Fe-S cluster-containing protein
MGNDNASGPSSVPIALVKAREEKREGQVAKVGDALQFVREALANEAPTSITVTVHQGSGRFFTQHFGEINTFNEIVSSAINLSDMIGVVKAMSSDK